MNQFEQFLHYLNDAEYKKLNEVIYLLTFHFQLNHKLNWFQLLQYELKLSNLYKQFVH